MAAWTFDELYGRDGKFLDGLEQRRQTFVGEVPMDFHGWVQQPRILRFGPKKSKRPGRAKSIHGWLVAVRRARSAIW